VAGDLKQKYGPSNQAITITVASLGAAAARQSTVVDNTTNLFSDALVTVKLKNGSGTIAAQKACNVYAFASVDGGTTYTELAGATDAAETLTVPPNAILIGSVNMPTSATSYAAGPFSVASAFGGRGNLPASWGIIIENQTGLALDATGGNHSAIYQGVYDQYT
jgi:hypothetical protein